MGRQILHVALILAFTIAGAAVAFSTDLTVQIKSSPKAVKAGQDLDSTIKVVVGNDGDVEVKNIPVEIVLKSSKFCPVPTPHAAYSVNYFDGVLLLGGRESVTLKPGKSSVVPLHGLNTIPSDTPVGRTYFICAIVDAGDTLKETNEENNCACSPVRISGAKESPNITGYGESCISKGGNVTILGRNFGQGADRSVFIAGNGVNLNLPVNSWSDSMISARVPDNLSIREGQQYYIGIRNTINAELLSNTSAYINICPERKTEPAPGSGMPAPHFLY